MKIYKKSLSLLLICAISFSCDRKPSADFDTDKTEYSAGDIIKITDKSKNAHKYLWAIRDSKGNVIDEIEKATSTLTISMLSDDGNYDIHLTIYSKKGDKTASASNPVLVKTIRGILRILFLQVIFLHKQTTNQLAHPLVVLLL